MKFIFLSNLIFLMLPTTCVYCGTGDDDSKPEVTLRKIYDLMERMEVQLNNNMANMHSELNDINTKLGTLDVKIEDHFKKGNSDDRTLYGLVRTLQNETENVNRKVKNIQKKTKLINRGVNTVRRKGDTMNRKLDAIYRKTDGIDATTNDVHNETVAVNRKIVENGNWIKHIERKLVVCYKKIAEVSLKGNDTHTSRLTKVMANRISDIQRKSNNMVVQLNGTRRVAQNIDNKLRTINRKTVALDDKLNHTMKMTIVMDGKLNDFQTQSNSIERKVDKVYHYAQSETENMNRKLYYIINFFYKAENKDNIHNNKSTCPATKPWDGLELPETFRRKMISLGVVDKYQILGCKDHTGKEFVLIFPGLYENTSKLEVLITSRWDTTVDIESPFPGLNMTIFVKATEGQTVRIPNDFVIKKNLFSNVYSNKGIIIRSKASIFVHAVMYNKSVNGEVFMLIPSRFLSTNYYADPIFGYTRYDKTNVIDSDVTIVALKDVTLINVTQYTYHNDSFYEQIDETSQMLSPLNTLSFFCASPRHFRSSKAIGVFSRHLYETLTHYIFVPPKHSLGNIFIVPRLQAKACWMRFIIQTFSNLPSYYIKYSKEFYNTPFNFRWKDAFGAMIRMPFAIEVSLPAVVMASERKFSEGGNSRIFIPAMNQYSNHYKFIVPFPHFLNHFVIMIIKAEDVNCLMFDGRPVRSLPIDTEKVSVKQDIYSVIYLNVTTGQHEVYHTDNDVTFGLISAGTQGNYTYGFPVGLYLGIDNCTDQYSVN